MTAMTVGRQVEQFRENFRIVRDEVSRIIVGNEDNIIGIMTCLLARGHVLLEGIPGIGKTKLVQTLADVLHLKFSRIQFTPDLMPGDIIGTTIVRETDTGRKLMEFQPGPIFANLVLADEINRATPKTQSALLEAMQENSVSAGGQTHPLQQPFFVLATMNPLEMEGTYPLPEAQLDRFLMEIDVDYPDQEAERRILFDTTGAEESRAKPAMTAEDLLSAQRLVRRLPVGESVVEAILALVRSARPGPEAGELGKLISWGPGPRASQALMLAVRARALLDGRFAPSVDDVLELAEPVLKHRMALTFAARAEGETIPNVIRRLKARIG
jgi:MoxR-like ATPase